jgi:NitT/TauT family transport system permease protein
MSRARARAPRPDREVAAAALWTVLSVLTLFVGWVVAGSASEFVPPPQDVVDAVPDFVDKHDVISTVATSLQRLLVSVALAFVVGVAVAVLMSLDSRLAQILEIYVTAALGVPAFVAALFALIVFGLNSVGVYVAVIIVTFPFVTIAIRDALHDLDPRLVEMAATYRFGRAMRLRHVALPSIAPALIAALRNTHALGWKVVVVAEVFAARGGIGAEFQRAFGQFQLNEVVIWLFVFLLAIVAVEVLLLWPIERRVLAWRRGPRLTPRPLRAG